MLTLSIAMRFFLSKKLQTTLIVLGFAIGIAVNVFLGSLILSLQQNQIDTAIGDQPHIIISKENDAYIDNWQDILGIVESVNGISKLTSILDTRTFVMNINPTTPDDVILRASNLDDTASIFNLYDSETFKGAKPVGNEVIIGKEFSENLGIDIGDILELTTDPSPTSLRTFVSVVGIFDVGVSDLNSLWIFSPYEIGSVISKTTNVITSINIQVDDVFDADRIANELIDQLDDSDLIIENWKELNESLVIAIEAQYQSSVIIRFFVLLAVVIGITSVLSVIVLQKSSQIGILKAMGLSNRRSALVFIFQGMLFGIAGTIVGVTLGFILIWFFNTFAGVLFFIEVDPLNLFVSSTVSILASIFAGIIPAKNSANTEVIDIIRNN